MVYYSITKQTTVRILYTFLSGGNQSFFQLESSFWLINLSDDSGPTLSLVILEILQGPDTGEG